MNIHVSNGNSKMGHVKNISLPPGKSCINHALCWKQCYAKQFYLQYPFTRIAWDENFALYKRNPVKYWKQLDEYFNKRRKPIEYFRFHVSGDIPDVDYIVYLLDFCNRHKNTKFLCFTKRYEYTKLQQVFPINLSIIFSHWPGDNIKLKGVRQAWVYDPKNIDNRIPRTSFLCPGDCQACGMHCWKMKYNQSVTFNIH